YVTYRKDALAGHEAQVSQLTNSSATCFFNTSITKLIACANQEVIEHVELTNHETEEQELLQIDEVIINHGYERDMSLLENSDLDITRAKNYFIARNTVIESSIDGIYAAVDILKLYGKLNLFA